MPETPEQKARREIDAKLVASGWIVQDKKAIDFNAGRPETLRARLAPTQVGRALRARRQPAA